MAGGYAIAALAPTIYVAVPAVVIASLGNGAAVVCNALFVQRGAPDELRGRAFTVIMSSNYATARARDDRSPARSPTRSAPAGCGAPPRVVYLVGALFTVVLAPRGREPEEALA